MIFCFTFTKLFSFFEVIIVIIVIFFQILFLFFLPVRANLTLISL